MTCVLNVAHTFFCLCLFQPDGLVNQKTMTSIITPTKQSKHYTIKPCDGMTPDAMRARWRPDHFAHFRDVCVSLGGVAFPKITLCLEFCAFVKVVYFRPSSTSSFHSRCKCVYVCMCVHEFSCLVMQLRVAEVRYSHHDCCGGALGGWMFLCECECDCRRCDVKAVKLNIIQNCFYYP